MSSASVFIGFLSASVVTVHSLTQLGGSYSYSSLAVSSISRTWLSSFCKAVIKVFFLFDLVFSAPPVSGNDFTCVRIYAPNQGSFCPACFLFLVPVGMGFIRIRNAGTFVMLMNDFSKSIENIKKMLKNQSFFQHFNVYSIAIDLYLFILSPDWRVNSNVLSD